MPFSESQAPDGDAPTSRTVNRSFRLAESLVERLRTSATEPGESANALAKRLIEEGLRRQEHPLVGFREGAAGRRAAVIGTRLDVWQVIETVRASSGSVADAARYFDVPESWVSAAIRYDAAIQPRSTSSPAG